MSNTTRPTRYSTMSLRDVVCLCAGPRDDEAWEEFVSRVANPIRHIIERTASMWGRHSQSLIDDLIQTTYLKLWDGGRLLLEDFAHERPEAILGYLKKTAANATHDHFKHGHSQQFGGNRPHVSTSDVDLEAEDEAYGSPEKISRNLFLNE